MKFSKIKRETKSVAGYKGLDKQTTIYRVWFFGWHQKIYQYTRTYVEWYVNGWECGIYAATDRSGYLEGKYMFVINYPKKKVIF